MLSQPLSPEEVQRIYEGKTWLLNHLQQPHTTASLAKHSALGIQKFKDGFHDAFGMTANRYLHESRMQTARVLLLHTHKPIKEIASICGYLYYKNFITAYRKAFGRTPFTERL